MGKMLLQDTLGPFSLFKINIISTTTTSNITHTTIATHYGCIIGREPAFFSKFLANLWLMPYSIGLLLGLLPKKHPSEAYLNLNHLQDVLACQLANKKTYLAQNLICETPHQLISTSCVKALQTDGPTDIQRVDQQMDWQTDQQTDQWTDQWVDRHTLL